MISHETFVKALMEQLPVLRRYATALMGNAAAADDLVQDSIERALRRSNQLRDLSFLAAWLRRILHNLYIDDLRRRRSQGIQQDIEKLVDDLELSGPSPDPGQMRDFLRAINVLSPEHRQILLLAGLEDLSYREIAAELGLPIGTVMSRLARARERLRELMEQGTSSNVIIFRADKQA
jgi:RNA polymerase sigma-70 factor (ECF subfamily)